MILTILAERSLASFNMQRALRSSAYSLSHIYALYRLVNNLDEPPRSSLQSTLTKILLFKGGVKPPRARPMQLPMLSHSSFRSAVKKWLKALVLHLRDFLVPFHLPPCNVVPAAHLSLCKLLINRRRQMAKLDRDVAPPCSCEAFLQQHPELQTVRRPKDDKLHVASPLDKLNFSRRLKFWMGVSAKTQVYPSFQQHLVQSWTQLQKWASRHLVSGINQAEWSTFLEEQWQQHLPGSKLPLSMSDIKYIREITKECFVIQGRDHAPDDLRLFCSRFYWCVLHQTFGGQIVYAPSSLTLSQARAVLQRQAKKPWLKRCSRGINQSAELPVSYVLLKKKKNFMVAWPGSFHTSPLFSLGCYAQQAR